MVSLHQIKVIFCFPLKFLFLLIFRWKIREEEKRRSEPSIPEFETLFAYAVLIIFGYLRDFLIKIGLIQRVVPHEKNREGYVPLYNNFEHFYRRNIFRLISYCLNQPICSIPGPTVQVYERTSDDFNQTYRLTDIRKTYVNMVSYNYLNMNQREGPTSDSVFQTILNQGVGVSSPRNDLGNCSFP